MTKCLLFDCDGTLVDSERLSSVGLVKVFSEQGVQLDPDELVLRFRGWKLSTIFEVLSSEYSVIIDEEIVPSYRRLVAKLFEKELIAIEGVEYALSKLTQPKAVVSSGPLRKVQQALRITGLSKFFDGNIYSSYEIGIWKPDPEIYNYAASDMGFSKSDCVVVDDAPVGVEAGCNAGIKTYFYNRFNESYSHPLAVSFQSMRELPQLIN